ncbi:MAG: oligopeptide/dipeptide ABC transporter ATP-binding protein, partial [Parvibaculaceae bacterium]
LQANRGTSLLFLSHDLAVVNQVADRLIVVFRGRIVEQGDPAKTYASPRHPYTAALLSAAPIADPVHERTRKRLKVAEVSENEPGSGCPYRDQCWLWRDLGQPAICASVAPASPSAEDSNAAACHFSEMAAKPVASAV